MDESATEQLRALARRDAHRAIGLTLRAVVHELRNAINPMPLQLALLRKTVPSKDGQADGLEGLRQSLERARETLYLASRLADEFAPHNSDDEDDQLWAQLCELL